MTKTDKAIELLKEIPFMRVEDAARETGIKYDTLKTALSQRGIKMTKLREQYVEQLEEAAPEDFEFQPQLKGDDNMEIVDVVELNQRGVEVEEEDSPVATRYFDDNGGLPEGNFVENNIKGRWIVIDRELKANKGIIAYRQIDDTTLVKCDNFEFGFDQELAKKNDITGDYEKIVVDVEKYNDLIELTAGFMTVDGKCVEVLLDEDDLFYLLQK